MSTSNSSNLNGLSLFLHTDPGQYESDVEAELEVDQLDSDTDPDEPVDATKNGKAKNGSNRPGERVPGHTLLPAIRLQNIIQADGVTGNLALSKEGLFILSIATEEFIKRLIQAGHREASAHRRNQINYTDMATTTQQYQEFMCLADTIPPPVSLVDALILRREREREMIDDNPALALPYNPALTHTLPIPSTLPSLDPDPESGTVSAPKQHKKTRTTNGKEKTNGSANIASRRSSKKSPKSDHEDNRVDERNIDRILDIADDMEALPSEPIPHNRRSSRNGLSAASSIPPPSINGQSSGISPSHSPVYYSSRENSLDPNSRQSHDAGSHSHSHSPPYDTPWPGQFTGPASGFLQGPAPTLGRVAQNPGRTIYSQNHRPD